MASSVAPNAYVKIYKAKQVDLCSPRCALMRSLIWPDFSLSWLAAQTLEQSRLPIVMVSRRCYCRLHQPPTFSVDDCGCMVVNVKKKRNQHFYNSALSKESLRIYQQLLRAFIDSALKGKQKKRCNKSSIIYNIHCSKISRTIKSRLWRLSIPHWYN